MKNPAKLDLKCEDFLRDNHHFYVHKARRKKIALINVEAANRTSTDVRLMLGDSKLMAGEQSYSVEPSDIIIRKLSAFTWDFVFYTILDFHPLLAAVDGFIFLSGPLYNRRLKKQLLSLSDGDMILKPGERKKAILGFRNPKGADTDGCFSTRRPILHTETPCAASCVRRVLPAIARAVAGWSMRKDAGASGLVECDSVEQGYTTI